MTPRNPADRPATEPRTEADPYKNRHPIRQWTLTDKVRQELDQIRSAGLSYDGVVADFDHAIRQERAEAASPAALDVEAISETMWLNRHLLDAGTTGASRSAYRKVAKQIAARLTEQEERG